MKKYDKIKRLGHRATEGILEDGKIEVTEKLDGNNFRITLNENQQIVMGSRNVVFTEDGNDYNEGSKPKSIDNIQDMFKDAAQYVKENVDAEELAQIEEELDADLTLFGENMVKHTLEYNWEEAPQWLLFGAYDRDSEEYLEFEQVQAIANALGIETVPIIREVTVEEFREEFDPENPDSVVPESNFREGMAEGIVLRNKKNGKKAKVLTEEFKEKHRSSDGGSHGTEHLPEDDTMELVNTYATDARIRKHIKKLTVDKGKDLEMRLMEELPMQVVEDIFEEEYEEMVRTDKSIQFKKFRSRVADKCLENLKAEMRKKGVSE